MGQDSWSLVFDKLEQTRRKSISLQEQVDSLLEPWYANSPSFELYEHHEELRAQSIDCQKSYAQGLCRLFCQQFYSKLPRELRDMVYDYMHPADENLRNWVSPATDENLRYYGPEIVRELAQSYYSTKHLYISSETPAYRLKQFNKDATGLVPALFARKVFFMADAYIFFNTSTPKFHQLMRLLQRLRPMRKGTIVFFQIGPCWDKYIRRLNSGMREYYPVLEDLHQAGLKVEVSFSLQGTYGPQQRIFCSLDSCHFEDFETKTLKYMAEYRSLYDETSSSDHGMGSGSDSDVD